MADKSDDDGREKPEVSEVDQARRRLLALAGYLPPAVLGVLVLDNLGCQPAPSCNPNTCNPRTNPCNPDNCPPRGGGCGPGTPCGPGNCNPTCPPRG